MNVPNPFVAFDALTDDQLHELDADAIEFYIDHACAEEGIKLLPPDPPVAPARRTVPKSVTHYTLLSLRFSDKDAAERVAAAVNREHEFRRTTATHGERYRYNAPAYDTKEDSPDVQVQIDRVYTAAEAAEQDGDDERTKDAQATYDRAKKDYDKSYKERQDVARRIYNRVSEAHEIIRRREFVRDEHNRYIVLAGGDATIAARFLWKAYGAMAELIGIAKPADVVVREPEPVEASAADEVL